MFDRPILRQPDLAKYQFSENGKRNEILIDVFCCIWGTPLLMTYAIIVPLSPYSPVGQTMNPNLPRLFTIMPYCTLFTYYHHTTPSEETFSFRGHNQCLIYKRVSDWMVCSLVVSFMHAFFWIFLFFSLFGTHSHSGPLIASEPLERILFFSNDTL